MSPSTYLEKWTEYYTPFFDEVLVIKGRNVQNIIWSKWVNRFNEIQAGLLASNDLVMMCDVDEFVVPNPDKYKDLGDYLDQVENNVRATGYNIMEVPGDYSLDLTKPVLEQRDYWSPDKLYNKYVILKTAQKYTNPHEVEHQFDPDPDLILFHLRDADTGLARKRAGKLKRRFVVNDFKERLKGVEKIPTKYKAI